MTLKELRLKNRLTQIEVARQTKTTKNYIGALERGIRNPSDKMKNKLAILYKTTLVKIFLALQETKCSVEGGDLNENKEINKNISRITRHDNTARLCKVERNRRQ